MAYDITYPIDFRSGGDSVKAAFSKLIEEVRTIYGILNELAGDDFTDEQRASILASLTGNIDGSRITGNIDAVHISGTLTASKVSGALTNATIPCGNVTGIRGEITKILPESSGYGITESEIADTGYVKFANGIIVQWGNSGAVFGESAEALFFYPFRFIKVLTVQVTLQDSDRASEGNIKLLEYGEAGIKCYLSGGISSTASVNYLAIGYGGK